MPIRVGSIILFGNPRPLRGKESVAPPTPPANQAEMFFRSNSEGKTQLCVVHDDGTISVISTQV